MLGVESDDQFEQHEQRRSERKKEKKKKRNNSIKHSYIASFRKIIL